MNTCTCSTNIVISEHGVHRVRVAQRLQVNGHVAKALVSEQMYIRAWKITTFNRGRDNLSFSSIPSWSTRTTLIDSCFCDSESKDST